MNTRGSFLLRTCAEDIQAKERDVLRRWLREHSSFSFVGYGTETLIRMVQECGGDPEKLRLGGRLEIINSICKEKGV
jgi:hypothetical protein